MVHRGFLTMKFFLELEHFRKKRKVTKSITSTKVNNGKRFLLIKKTGTGLTKITSTIIFVTIRSTTTNSRDSSMQSEQRHMLKTKSLNLNATLCLGRMTKLEYIIIYLKLKESAKLYSRIRPKDQQVKSS